ncbi:MAG: protein-L-isoaspartate(D-aspartate) O-methyltransferase [Bacteroidia bacterium]|nr:protein-L-isoaspartate(D-aspartate) O-methyltransferase [Bacteroidia bacterium]
MLLSSVYSQPNFQRQRERMVMIQLKTRDIYHNATLEAMGQVPRHKFVPEESQPFAYSDHPLSIGHGQTISQPYIVAFMTQAIRPKKDHKVLEIGTGSGYQAAVLAEIVDSVYTIEIVDVLAREAKNRLKSLQYNNVKVRSGDGYHGWPEAAPFDAIVVTAGAEEIPMKLFEQLKEGGKMVMPLGPHGGIRQLIRITKKKGEIKIEELMPVRFVPFTRDKN